MKRYIYSTSSRIVRLEWNLDIYLEDMERIESATSVIDSDSQGYQDFIEEMISVFSEYEFEIYRDEKYTHKSNRGSLSDYFTFLKISNYTIIEVVVNIRISDHPVPKAPYRSSEQK